MRKTNIQPWTRDWEKAYRQEEALLKGIFEGEWTEIHHIGSTSVPGIGYAKPIIDILIAVKKIKNVDNYNEKMKEIGYEPKGENGISGRRYFPKGKENRTHHVHIFEEKSEQIRFHLDFRNYLIEHPMEAKKYGDLKVYLAEKYPMDHYNYQEGKQEFVNKLAEKVKRWAISKANNIEKG